MQIRNNDIPERMQLREIPVTPVPEDSNELNEEAEWIYNQAFCKPTASSQVNYSSYSELSRGVDTRKCVNCPHHNY